MFLISSPPGYGKIDLASYELRDRYVQRQKDRNITSLPYAIASVAAA